jgi:AAA domain
MRCLSVANSAENEPMTDLIKTSAQFVRDFVPPDYVVDGIFQRRFCYSITAKTGSGKTAVAMLIAAHVATGLPLGSLDVAKGDVMYFAFENPTDIQMRWLGLTQEMRIAPEQARVHFVSGVPRLSEVADAITAEVIRKQLQPVLVVVDTVAASFEGDSDNDNVQMGDHARLLRSLTLLPGGPAVLVLAHPTKNAVEPEGLVPKGGGAFLNEVDGNIGLMKRENVIGAQVVGKFRGPEFPPISFELKAVRHPILKDSRGRDIPTVIARALDEARRVALDAAGDQDEDKLLRIIEKHPRAGLRGSAAMLGWRHHAKVERLVNTLIQRKLVKREGRSLLLTQAGQKELNAQESTVSPLSHVVSPPLALPPFPGVRIA